MPETVVSRGSGLSFFALYLSGSLKREMPTWRIGTSAPSISFFEAFCMSGRLLRYVSVTTKLESYLRSKGVFAS